MTIADHALRFVDHCRDGGGGYRLSPASEASAYATCFAVFVRHALMQPTDALRGVIAKSLLAFRQPLNATEIDGKAYKQLLAFSLSALELLQEPASAAVEALVREQIQGDVTGRLRAFGALDGKPQSGNNAMFLAIFLLHARDRLGISIGSQIDEWVTRHLEAMNRFGFWGSGSAMTHLQFQNGYHQHEILEYLGIPNPREKETLRAVASLADREGHFAPYPGGGGCFDYDAVFLLTPGGRAPNEATVRLLLQQALRSIQAEQNEDGGFCESRRVRPRSPRNLAGFAGRVATSFASWPLFRERLFYALNLQRPKHDRIHTHWTKHSRRWGESNLWDTWFRLLTLARIEVAFNPVAAKKWGFINYPGIGFHPSCRAGWSARLLAA